MPSMISETSGGTTHGNPFVGPIDHTAHVKLDISGMTANEIDTYGFIKPGVPLTAAGILVTAGFVYGVTIEPVKVAADNAGATLAAATDVFVVVATHGVINRDIAEDVLGRAYTAAEIAGFDAAGSHIRLLPT